MANTNVWVDQLRADGKSAASVSKLIQALEKSGLDVKVCYRTPETLEWLANAPAVEQASLFRRRQTSFWALTGLLSSLGVIAFSWFFPA